MLGDVSICKSLASFLFFVLMIDGYAQKYYVAGKGDMSIHFGYNDGISIANSEVVDIIFSKEKIILWITTKGSDFKTGNKKIDRRLFRKNENEFVIKAELIQKNVIYGRDDLLEFSLIGRIFNKVEGGAVSIMGAFGESLDGQRENLSLYMYFGVETKWLGERFVKYSDYPVVNIRITAELVPFDDDQLKISKNN